MDGPFQFAADAITSISFKIEGECITDGDCDMFFGFGDGNRYWTMSFCLDEWGVMNYNGDTDVTGFIAIYPTPGDIMASGDILSLLDDVANAGVGTYWTDLRDKVAGGAGENFYDISTEKDQTWPITVTVTNDIFANMTYINVENGDRSVNASYIGTFETDTPLSFPFTSDVYTTGGVEGFNIFSIDVTSTRIEGMYYMKVVKFIIFIFI